MPKKSKSESCGKRKIEGFLTESEKKVIVSTLGLESEGQEDVKIERKNDESIGFEEN